jgi:integrase
MVRLQRLTGMRAGEVTQMRTGDLNTSGAVWEYRPWSHKTEHHDRDRVVFLGPQPQETLKPWLRTDLQAYLFSPRRRAHRWHPHQLRHTVATRIRQRFGLDAAQVVLGHSELGTTQVYAERNSEAARDVMKAIG